MKILKKILYVLIGLIALLLIVAIFLPSHYRVSRSIEIKSPVDTVFTQVVDFNNLKNWDPWSPTDPAAKYAISGQAGQVGSKWSWDGEKVGIGSLTIEEISPNKSIKLNLIFTKPQQTESKNTWMFDVTSSGTKATWSMEGNLSYPIERYFGLLMDGMIGPDFEKGLANLKKGCEK